MSETDFRLEDELTVDRGERVLRSIEDARTYVRDVLRERPDPRWQAVFRRLDSVDSESDAHEAARAMRELLESEGLLRAQTAR